MSRMLAAKLLLSCAALTLFAGCANRAGWGFASGQGTVDRQKSRAVVHDPYPLNDIGPPVMGGRPRDYIDPQGEVSRANAVPRQFPSSFGFGP